MRCGIRLLDGVRRVDISTTIDNRAGDHRLRVLFDLPFLTEYSEAEGAFDVVRRPAGPLPGSDDLAGERGCHLSAEILRRRGRRQRGVLLANRGLPEFEVQPSGDGMLLALTLLRCVGWLSRDDLATRPGHAGPALATPGGQTFGVHTFEYALAPYAEDWLQGGAYALAHSFAVPLYALAETAHAGPLPPAATLISCDPAEFVLSALKRSEDGTALILRAWNIAGEPIEARVTLPSFIRAASRVRLDEQEIPGAALDWQPGPPPSAAVTLGAHEILTLRLEL